MRNLGLGILILISCTACEKEGFVRYELSPQLQSWLPGTQVSATYASADGDTFDIELKRNESFFVAAPNTSLAPGEFNATERVELERQQFAIGKDTPFVRFVYNLKTILSQSVASGQRDSLSFSFRDANGNKWGDLRLQYDSFVSCASQNCAFSDSLVIDTIAYQNVFYDTITDDAWVIIDQDGPLRLEAPNGSEYQRTL